MPSFLESVPNFSEGRRADVVDGLVRAARSVGEVTFLGVHTDPDHNRSVLSLAGPPEALAEAVFRAVRQAVETIDLRTHEGRHPRIGAADVVPFIPLGSTPMSEAIAAARTLASRLASELDLPVYLYEHAAARPERRSLERVRRSGFEELRDTIETDDERAPDLGPRRVHPTAGAVAVGARGPLIAYNIYLDTPDVEIARAIARAVRHSSGGLRYVKALGLEISSQGNVQVSMNLTDFRKTAMATVFDLVRSQAESHGVRVTRSEVVGLLPAEALVDVARHYLRMHDFELDQVLELKLMEAGR